MSHLKRLHALPCVVHKFVIGAEQSSPTVVHHLESVRDGDTDYAGVALCDACHKDLHRLSRRGFEMRYKLTPIDLLALTVKALEKEGLLV